MGIADDEIAFALDRECAEILYLWEQEQEAQRLDAMMSGTLLSQLNGQKPAREITSADIRDQSW